MQCGAIASRLHTSMANLWRRVAPTLQRGERAVDMCARRDETREIRTSRDAFHKDRTFRTRWHGYCNSPSRDSGDFEAGSGRSEDEAATLEEEVLKMRRILLMSSLLAGLVAFGSKPAAAWVSADINIHVGDRAPVAYFYNEPRGYVIPNYYNDVWYYQNPAYDLYRYGNVWYMNDGGYWYSAPSWRGPFVGVRFQSVPSRIVRVPVRYHRESRGYWQEKAPHYTWSSQTRYRDSDRSWSRDDDRRDSRQWSRNDDKDHDKGKGKKNGHGKSKSKGSKGNNGRWH